MKFKFLSVLTGVITTALFATSCTNDLNNDYYTPVESAAYGYIVNASPSSGDLYFYADQNLLNSTALNYGNSAGYYRFYLGNRTFSIKSSAGTSLATTSLTLNNQDYFGLFAVNTFNNIELVAYRDTLVQPAAGNARVRFINLVPDSPELDVATPSASLATGLSFKEATDFIEVAAGTYDITFKNTNTGTIITTDTAEILNAGYIYTIYVKGFVSPATGTNDTATAVKLTNYRG